MEWEKGIITNKQPPFKWSINITTKIKHIWKNETVELDACTSEIVQNPSPTFGIQCQGLIDKESAMPCRPARPSFRSPPALWQMIHLKISSSHQFRIAGNVASWRQAKLRKTAQNCLHLLTQIGNAFEDASSCSFPLLASSEAKAETLLRINSTCWLVCQKQTKFESVCCIDCLYILIYLVCSKEV